MGSDPHSLPQYTNKMKRHIKSAITRLRKLQDNAFNHKTRENVSIDINSYYDAVTTFYSIHCHIGQRYKHFFLSPNDSVETVQSVMDKIEKFFGFKI